MKKYFILSVLSILICWFSFAQTLISGTDIYFEDADQETQLILSETNSLISQNKYEEAFLTVQDEKNEFLLAKKIEIALNYFIDYDEEECAFSICNLEEGESLELFRYFGNETANKYTFDIVKSVSEYIEENNNSPLLDLYLGYYYYFSYNFITASYSDYYYCLMLFDNALAENVFTGYTLSFMAECYVESGDYGNAYAMFKIKEEALELNAIDYYNYSLISYYNGLTEESMELIEKAILMYEDTPELVGDACVVAALINMEAENFEKASEFFVRAKEVNPSDYKPYLYEITLYAFQNMKDESIYFAQDFFSIQPQSQEVSRMIIEQFQDSCHEEWLPELFELLAVEYEEDNSALLNIYFHWTYAYSLCGDVENAELMAQKTKEFFEQQEKLNDQVTSSLDYMLELAQNIKDKMNSYGPQLE